MYEKITKVLPDVVEEIKKFVRKLMSNRKIHKKLTYEWNNKDVIHLFFIVFKDKDLIKELKKEAFKQLVSFTKKNNGDTNSIDLFYVFYKLLIYFPLTQTQFNEKKFDSKIQEVIIDLIKQELADNTETRMFLRLVSSLPSGKDFKPQIYKLQTHYDVQRNPEYHDEGKSFNHNVNPLIITVREIIFKIKNNTPVPENEIKIVKRSWAKIFEFIYPVLSFYRDFERFLFTIFSRSRTIRFTWNKNW